MIAAVILIVSIVTLLEFFVSYCRALIAKSRRYELSEQVSEISGLAARTLGGDQFRRLLELIAVCPEPGDDMFSVRAVSIYFKLLGMSRALLNRTFPGAARWMESERGGCTYVAAMVLDRRIAYSRMLMSQQSGI